MSAFAKEGDWNQLVELGERKNKYVCAAGIAMMAAGAAVCIIGALRDGLKTGDIAKSHSSQLLTYMDDLAWIINTVR